MSCSLFVQITLSSMNPIGIYRRFSDDTSGITIHDLGFIVSLNCVWWSARLLVAESELLRRICLHFSTLSITKGIFLNSPGNIFTSHTHHRLLLLINSREPISRFMYGIAFGSFFIFFYKFRIIFIFNNQISAVSRLASLLDS